MKIGIEEKWDEWLSKRSLIQGWFEDWKNMCRWVDQWFCSMQPRLCFLVDQSLTLQLHIFHNTSGPVRLCIATHPQCLGGEVDFLWLTWMGKWVIPQVEGFEHRLVLEVAQHLGRVFAVGADIRKRFMGAPPTQMSQWLTFSPSVLSGGDSMSFASPQNQENTVIRCLWCCPKVVWAKCSARPVKD